MKRSGFFLAVIATTLVVTTARAGVSVTLECNSSTHPGLHNLLDLDYAARTVRNYSVNDDGAPYTFNGTPMADRTFPAQVTDKEIMWTEQMAAGPNYLTLGRYSGTLTVEIHFQSTRGAATTTNRYQCRRWTPEARQQKF